MKCCLEYNRDVCFVVGGGLEYVILFLDANDAEIDISGYDSFDYYLVQGDEEVHCTLSNYLSIVGTGGLQIAVPNTAMADFIAGKIQHQFDVTQTAGITITHFTGSIPSKDGIV